MTLSESNGMPKLLTTEEVAERVRTSPATVRYWHHAGTGPRSFKVGRRRLYDEADLEAWIEAARAKEGCGCRDVGDYKITCAPHLMAQKQDGA